MSTQIQNTTTVLAQIAADPQHVLVQIGQREAALLAAWGAGEDLQSAALVRAWQVEAGLPAATLPGLSERARWLNQNQLS